MIRALRWPALAVVLLAALVVTAALDRPAASPGRVARSSALPVTETTLVCPNVTGSETAPTTVTIANVSRLVSTRRGHPATLRTTPLFGVHARTTKLPSRALTRVHQTAAGYPLRVVASGAGGGAIAADQTRLIPRGSGRGLFSAPCLQPAEDWWITGPDGRVGYADTLVLANPGSTVVNLTATVWSTKGRLEPPKLQSFTVPPNSSHFLALSTYAPDAGLLTVHIHANTGRLVAAVVDRRVSGITAAGVDWIPPTLPPSSDLVVPGFVGGPGGRHLVLTDPGTRDATVTLKLSTAAGSFAPAGHQTVVVRAGHSADVDLTSSLGGAPGSVVVHSDAPVTAAALSSAAGAGSRARPDIQWQPAAVAVTGPAVLADNTPPFQRQVRVYVTAATAASRLRVTAASGASRVLAVPAGRTVAWDPVAEFHTVAYGPLVFAPVSGGPAYVARTLFAYGAHGPLTTSEQPALLPASISLPGAVPDQRVVVPEARR